MWSLFHSYHHGSVDDIPEVEVQVQNNEVVVPGLDSNLMPIVHLGWNVPRELARPPFYMRTADPRMFRVTLNMSDLYVWGWNLYLNGNFLDAVVRGEQVAAADAMAAMYSILTAVDNETSARTVLPRLNSEVMSPDAYVHLPGEWMVPLMESQKQSLAWMHAFETRVFNNDNGVDVPRWARIGDTQSGWIPSRRFVLPLSVLVDLGEQLPMRTISYFGGVLADAMGSGKTATMLALIASTASCPPPPVSLLSQRKVPLEDVVSLVPVRASLVIVPLNLSRQWMDEVLKFCPHLRVVRLINKRDHDVVTHANIMAADMVLTTQNFLSGRPYVSNLNAPLSLPHASLERAAAMRTGIRLDEKQVYLSNFFWRRIVFDELHECSHMSAHLHSLQGAVYWGMTGTPAMNTLSVNNLVWRIPNSDLSAIRTDTGNPRTTSTARASTLLAQLVDATLRRTRFVPPLPPLHVREVCVSLTQRERDVVEAHSTVTSRVQLATSLSVLALMNRQGATHEEDEVLVSMSFREVSRLMLAQRASELDSAQVDVRGLETTLQNDRALLTTVAEHDGVEVDGEEETGSTLMRAIKRRMKLNERQLVEARARLQSLTQQHEYFKTQLEDESKRQCPICMGDEADVITQCGHWFCGVCIREYLKTRTKATCPMCKQVLVARDWMQVKEDGASSASAPEPSGEDLCGTKLQAIMALVRECKARGERVIMFVQWVELMRAVRALLVKAGVSAVAVSGNTNARNLAVSKMQSGEADVLLLSLDTSTSGLNLVQANHVIFAHALVPGLGTGESREAMERQAIARVHRLGQTKPVTVHWCLAENTDETRLHRTGRA